MNRNVAVLMATIAVAIGMQLPYFNAQSAPDRAPKTRADIHLDLSKPETGKMGVEMRLFGLDAKKQVFKELGVAPEHVYTDVSFATPDGQPVGFDKKKTKYTLAEFEGDELIARYTVQPGGVGRHGHQGVINGDFSVFDGRVYLMPNSDNGLDQARITVTRPDGWIVASPFREVSDTWFVDDPDEGLVNATLANTCIGVGPYREHNDTFGNMELRVYTFMPWEDEHEHLVATNTINMASWFHQTLGWDLQSPYAVVWTPMISEARTFGGSYANSACFEMPNDRRRNWELLGHRIGHAMNKYHPSGMYLRDERDHWFMEGWASYIEIKAVQGSGIHEGEPYFTDLYSQYLNRRGTKVQDLAMADEPFAPDDPAVTYMHYIKGPLVVRQLDHWMTEQCGGSGLEPFMAAMWDTYGRYNRAFPLREEIDRFCGTSVAPFMSTWVDQPGFVNPTWPDWVTAEMVARADAPPAATADGEPVSGDYLYWLAASGHFARFHDIVEFVVAEARNRRILDAIGVHVLGPREREVLAGISPQTRYEAALSMESYPKPALAPISTSSGGCGGGDTDTPEGPRPAIEVFIVDQSHPDGADFAALLQAEIGYEAGVGRRGLGHLEIRAGTDDKIRESRPVLAYSAQDDVVVTSVWGVSPGVSRYRLSREGTELRSKDIRMEPDWLRSWSTFRSDKRGEERGVHRYEIGDADEWLVERAVWQR